MNPILSIVIANYNYGRFIETAIRSVVDQEGFEACELIVVDGGSTDNSVELIRKYEKNISWWVSEKDKGQSDAFNKGFAHSRGRYLTWLNADDFLVKGCLRKIVSELERHPECEWFSGETIYVDAEERVVTAGLSIPNVVANVLRSPAWARITAPSTFFTRDLLARAGGFDLDLHYVMDHDLWMKFSNMGTKLRYLGFPVWVFKLHEESKTSASVTSGTRSDRFVEEKKMIRARAGITPAKDLFAVWCKRFACLISFSYFRRALFLSKYRGRKLTELEVR